MNKTTRYIKRVLRLYPYSTHTLGSLMSMLRVWLEYALLVHEPMFVGPRTYVRESANLCLSAHEPMFLFRRSHTGTVPVCQRI